MALILLRITYRHRIQSISTNEGKKPIIYFHKDTTCQRVCSLVQILKNHLITVFSENMYTIQTSVTDLFLHLKNCHWKMMFDVSFCQDCSFVWIIWAQAVCLYSIHSAQCESAGMGSWTTTLMDLSWMVCPWICSQKIFKHAG